jgi:hypothetical protein
MRAFKFWIRYLFLRLVAPNARVTLEFRLLVLLNRARVKAGLKKLFFASDLRAVARKHSQDMARNDYFAHDNLSGHSPKKRFENDFLSEVVAGENLAMNRGFKNPTEKAHDGLMNSPGHRANILSEVYNCVGIGLAISEDKTYYFTQNFSYKVFRVLSHSKVLWFSSYCTLKLRKTDESKSYSKVRVLVKNYLDEVILDKDYDFKFATVKIKVLLPKAGKYSVELVDPVQNFVVNKFKVQKVF